MLPRPPRSTLFPYTTLFRSRSKGVCGDVIHRCRPRPGWQMQGFYELWSTTGSTIMNRRALKIRSEEHTSELQSRQYLVCRLLLEKKKRQTALMYKHSQRLIT